MGCESSSDLSCVMFKDNCFGTTQYSKSIICMTVLDMGTMRDSALATSLLSICQETRVRRSTYSCKDESVAHNFNSYDWIRPHVSFKPEYVYIFSSTSIKALRGRIYSCMWKINCVILSAIEWDQSITMPQSRLVFYLNMLMPHLVLRRRYD